MDVHYRQVDLGCTHFTWLTTTFNCSSTAACGEVDTKRTKNSCCSSRPGKFAFAVYTFMCFWYCFLRAPETSSAETKIHTVNRSSPLSIWRNLLGILAAYSWNASDSLTNTLWPCTRPNKAASYTKTAASSQGHKRPSSFHKVDGSTPSTHGNWIWSQAS